MRHDQRRESPASAAESTGLAERLYEDLLSTARRLMRDERRGHTLEPAALVHEALLRVDLRRAAPEERSRCFAAAARAMRHVLVDHARARRADKRHGSARRVTLHDAPVAESIDEAGILALEEALARLETKSPRQARVVELRFFAGLGVDEVATILGVSTRTVKGDWSFARAWLERELRSR